MYPFFEYLERCTGRKLLIKSNQKFSNFDAWCNAVDIINFRLLGKYQIRWYANPVSVIVIKPYYDSGCGPEAVDVSDYKEASKIEIEYETGEYDIDLMNEFDPPDDLIEEYVNNLDKNTEWDGDYE